MGCYGAIRDDLTLAALATVHRIDHTWSRRRRASDWPCRRTTLCSRHNI